MAIDTVPRPYSLLQSILSKIFSAPPPAPGTKLSQPKIAVIGAGLTGVSAASHCVGNGFDVTIFEADGPDHVGGIWAKVNSTSGLQIHSMMYRFHPSVRWEDDYPKQGRIVTEIRNLWLRYGLQNKTKFHTTVTKIYKDEDGLWIVNDPSNGRFHGVIPAIGTCGAPYTPRFRGQDSFAGEIFHSSELDGKTAQGKKVVVIGGGASAIEALEWAADTDSSDIKVLSRSEKWIIPRNLFIDTILACNIFGYETFFSWIPETLIRLFHYRDLREISPSKDHGLYTDTPMVDNDTLRLIRSGKAEWLRGDIIEMRKDGIVFNHRRSGVPKGGHGQTKFVAADFIVLATGYERPSLGFLPNEVFAAPYSSPRWFMQVFPTQHPSICCNNCTYINGVGSVGNWHIGMYTRLLLVFLLDPFAAPSTWAMQRWVDLMTLLKIMSPTEAFDFFTYPELISWFFFVVAVNPFRWKWALFVLFGLQMPSLKQPLKQAAAQLEHSAQSIKESVQDTKLSNGLKQAADQLEHSTKSIKESVQDIKLSNGLEQSLPVKQESVKSSPRQDNKLTDGTTTTTTTTTGKPTAEQQQPAKQASVKQASVKKTSSLKQKLTNGPAKPTVVVTKPNGDLQAQEVRA